MALVLVTDPEIPDPAVIARAATVLRAGGLVAFPTETVYGLGANALDVSAVQRVFAAKGRPAVDPLIVHVVGRDDLAIVATSVPPLALWLADAFWPGPLTLVVPRGPRVPTIVTAGLDTVAVRAPSHPVARAILTAAAIPVAAPSANRFGHTSPTTAAHVLADLGDRIDLVVDAGPTPLGVESTVVDCLVDPPLILRPGSVPLEALREVAPGIRLAARSPTEGAQRSPGQLARHYAPTARLILVTGPDEDVCLALGLASRALQSHRMGLLVADEDVGAMGLLPDYVSVVPLAGRSDPATAARRLFAGLRDLDAAGVTLILARDFGTAGLALAVRDRLARAAEGTVIEVLPGGAAEAAERIGAVVG